MSNWSVDFGSSRVTTNLLFDYNVAESSAYNLQHINIRGTGFNGAVSFPATVNNFYYTFDNCQSLNSHISGNFQLCNQVSGMFCNCHRFNQPVDIINIAGASYAGNVFRDCHSFNCLPNPYSISNGSRYINMFRNCRSLNSEIIIYQGTDCSTMFKGCSNMRSRVTIMGTTNNVVRNARIYPRDYDRSSDIPYFNLYFPEVNIYSFMVQEISELDKQRMAYKYTQYDYFLGYLPGEVSPIYADGRAIFNDGRTAVTINYEYDTTYAHYNTGLWVVE